MTYRRAFATPRDGVMQDGTIRYRASKIRPRRLRAQTQVPPKRCRPQDRPLDLRSSSRQGPRYR